MYIDIHHHHNNHNHRNNLIVLDIDCCRLGDGVIPIPLQRMYFFVLLCFVYFDLFLIRTQSQYLMNSIDLIETQQQ